MQTDTSLHADHPLDQLAAPFEPWRQSRSPPPDRLPEALWGQAVALAQTLLPARVAKHWRLGRSDLTKQLAKGQGQAAAQRSVATGCVEVPRPCAPPQGRHGIAVERHRPDGARRRFHAPDAALPLAASIPSCVAARR
jgi:hypothetical protein